jgi:hypothetical protein
MTEGVSNKPERTPSQEFREQLHGILYTPLSVENIGHFADDALNELIELSASVVHKYQQEYPESDALSGAALEDAAYAVYGLENLGTVLDRITAVRDRIAAIGQRVQESLAQTNSVIVPPDQTGPAFRAAGSGTYEAPDKLNRLITLAYILETDFDIDQNSVRYRQGTTTDTMVRQEPYVRVEIDDLNRVVYVCDEEGNASYVFDTKVLAHLGIDLLELDKMTKNQRNAFLRVTPEAGRRIVQSPAWRNVVSEALQETFASDGKVPAPTEILPRSEFAERGKFLEFEDFETDVKVTYAKAGKPEGVAKWYKSEYVNHAGWPSSPSGTYKDKGWQSYPELVGREKNVFLDFANFVSEVRVAYAEAENPKQTYKWYQEERLDHPQWPSAPEKFYKDNGWQSYPELIGREKIVFLGFANFVSEVRVAYKQAGSPVSVIAWYREVYKKHRGWPAYPNESYQDTGWEGFPELVGREKVEFPNFTNFVSEVRVAYKQAGSPVSVTAWYREVYKKHRGWPAAPEQTYSQKGWKSYPELVEQELLNFTEFKNTVKIAYQKAGSPQGIAKWFLDEYKNHSGWPSSPQQVYKDKGWQGYPHLIGREVTKFLEYSDFVAEVRMTYTEAGAPGDVAKWYQGEYKNHPGWPSAPEQTYSQNGWKSYPKLAGKV